MKGRIFFTKLSEEQAGHRAGHEAGEKLLETALKREFDLNLKDEPRSAGKYGKPFLVNHPEIHYNLSHSGDYVLCILADQPVGIDVQKHKKVNKEKLLKKMVPSERIPKILGAEDPEQAFFDQWALREAYVKWTGNGISMDLTKIPMEEGWHILLSLEPGYSGAVWAAEAVTPLDMQEVCIIE